jgi:(p)ppGpp synthase/HD superfamily hydrolase
MSGKVAEAFRFAWDRHQGQKKGSGVPFVYHPLAVASQVLRYGGDEDLAAAALVHDTIASVTEAELQERFGAETARIAYGFEDPPLPEGAGWTDAKRAYLAKVRSLDERTLLVVACEELHECGELLHDLRYEGASVWKRYPVHSMEVFWYFKELLAIFHTRLKRPELISEFARAVAQLKGITLENKAF